jgi:hypothetical protein
MSPSLSSAGAMIVRAAVSPPSADGSMSPATVILISFSVFATSGIFLCVWRRLFSLRTFRYLSARISIPQGLKNDGEPENGQPGMFDTWIERCIPNNLKWDEYMVSTTPFAYLGWALTVQDFDCSAFLRERLHQRRNKKRIWPSSESWKTSGRQCDGGEGGSEKRSGKLLPTSRRPCCNAVAESLRWCGSGAVEKSFPGRVSYWTH